MKTFISNANNKGLSQNGETALHSFINFALTNVFILNQIHVSVDGFFGVAVGFAVETVFM